jgi:hypothetical protein
VTPLSVYRQSIVTTINWLSQFGADVRRSYIIMSLWQIQAGLSLPYNLLEVLPKAFLDERVNNDPDLVQFINSITLPIVQTPDPKMSVQTVYNLSNNFHAQVSSKLNFMQNSKASYEYAYHFEPIMSTIKTNNEQFHAEQNPSLESPELHLAQLEHLIPGRSFSNSSYIDISSPHIPHLISLLSDFIEYSSPELSFHTHPSSKKEKVNDYSLPRIIPSQQVAQQICSQSLVDDNARIGSFLCEQAEHGYSTRDLDPFKRNQAPVLFPAGYDEPPASNKKDILAAQLLQFWYNVSSVPSPIDTNELAQDEAWKMIHAPDMMLTANHQLKQHINKQFSQANTNLSNPSPTTPLDTLPDTSSHDDHKALLHDDSTLYKTLVHQQYLANVDTNLYVCSHHIELLHSLLLNTVSVLPFSVVANRQDDTLDLTRLITNKKM